MGEPSHDGELLVKDLLRWYAGAGLASDFRRKVEGRQGFWKRFAMLPNVEGQKYTIGSKLTSRKEQGEFIFLSEKQLDVLHPKAKESGTLCEIFCIRNKYFVKYNGKTKIFVNLKQITQRTELKFGDYLTFEERKKMGRPKKGESSDSAAGHEVIRFLFAKRELIPGEFLDSKAARDQKKKEKEMVGVLHKEGTSARKNESSSNSDYSDIMVGHNGLIISIIQSYLPFQDLKNSRLVSRVWNEEAIKILKTDATVKLDFEGNDYTKPHESMKLFRIHHEMKNAQKPPQNWEMYIPPFLTCSCSYHGNNGMRAHKLDPSEGFPGSKLVSDLNWFLNKWPLQNIKSLKLGGKIDSVFDYDLKLKILAQFQETLEELEIWGSWKMNAESNLNHFEAPSRLKFGKLERFSLAMHLRDFDGDLDDLDGEDFSELRDWVGSWIQAVAGIKALALKGSMTLGLICLENLDCFKNLEELSFDKTTLEAIDLLMHWGRGFKTLKLNELVDLHQDNVPTFEAFFLQQSQTLVTLEFKAAVRNYPAKIRMPTFPKLKNLSIGNYPVSNSAPVILRFGGIPCVTYARDFPALQSLSLDSFTFPGEESTGLWVEHYSSIWKKFGDFTRIFLPNCGMHDVVRIGYEKQVCTTLRHLKLPQFFECRPEIAVMFPNVYNTWMNQVFKELQQQE